MFKFYYFGMGYCNFDQINIIYSSESGDFLYPNYWGIFDK